MAINERDEREAMDRLDQFLDHLADHDQLQMNDAGIDPALADALLRLQAKGDQPIPNPRFVNHLEERIMNASVKIGPQGLIPPLTHGLNGHVTRRRIAWKAPAEIPSRRTSRFDRLSSVALYVVVLLIVGFVFVRENPGSEQMGSIPMFRGGAARTGEQPGPGPQGVPAALWTFTTGGKVVSSPSTAEGLLFAGSDDGIFHALDAKTGEERWQATLSGAIGAAPAIVDGTVYVGDQTGHLYAFDSATGEQRWSISVGTGGDASLYASAPVVVDGVVYLTSGGGASSPAVLDGVVYVGGDDSLSVSNKVLRAFDAATGAQKWRFPEASQNASLNLNGLYAIEAATGIERWQFRTDGYVRGAPAVANGVAYVGSKDGALSAVDVATGTSLWSFKTGKAIYSSPAVAGGVVYVGSTDGVLYALDATTGAEFWRAPVGVVRASSPAVADDAVYIVAAGQLIALEAGNGSVRWTMPVGEGADSSPAVAGGLVFVGGITQPEKSAVVIAFGDMP